jgi:hypothetical protein
VAYYRVADARAAFYRSAGRTADVRTAESLLKSAAKTAPGQRFDIFLSHSFNDAIQIQGVKALLEEQNWTVYVDWIDDPELDRTKVTKATARRLRERMNDSSSMIFASSVSSPTSKWMPWELGYFDGLRGRRIAILPLVNNSDSEYRGQEYLDLYPTIEKLPTKAGGERSFVTKGARSNQYKTMESFAKGAKGFQPVGS